MELTWGGYRFSVLVQRSQEDKTKPGPEVSAEKAAVAVRNAETKYILASGCRQMTITR